MFPFHLFNLVKFKLRDREYWWSRESLGWICRLCRPPAWWSYRAMELHAVRCMDVYLLKSTPPWEAKYQRKLMKLLVNASQSFGVIVGMEVIQRRWSMRDTHVSGEVWGRKSILGWLLCNLRSAEWGWLTHLIWHATFFCFLFCITSLVDSVLVLLLWSLLSLTVFSITT